VAKVAIRDFLTTLNRERQTTVLLTTHDLDDIERLCPRILVIDHGEVMYDGMLATLKSRWGGRRQLIVDYAGDPDPGVTSMDNGDLTVTEVDGPRVDVRDMSIQEPDIEDVIRRMYKGSIPAGV
jgi:ABC-2 type transport system ATP-binding protein